MSRLSSVDLYVSLLSVLLFYGVRKFLEYKRLRLPPGPSGYPIVGNFFDDFGRNRWIAWRDMSIQYQSDIIHLNMAGTPMIIVNSRAAAADFFEKRSVIYSDRPTSVMGNELSGMGWDFSFREYGSYWKERRALFHSVFQPPALLEFFPDILSSSRILLQQTLEKPSDIMKHIRHMTGRVILSVAYGIDVLPENDPFVNLADRATESLNQATQTAVYLVDSFPWMRHIPKWFPGAQFQKDAEVYKKDIVALPEVTLQFTKKAMAEGTARPSIGAKYLEDLEDSGTYTPVKEEMIRTVLGVMYSAGIDTIASALGTFVFAMILYPEVQRKAQAILDRTIGSGRLPDFSDRESLPYLNAVMREVLRWKPVSPLGLSHANSMDDVYNGYFIPKGSIVTGNSWAILYDKATYGEDPEVFRPERFMKGDDLDPSVPYPDAAFGFGRRICPGKDAAEASMWISIVSLLAVFKFSGEEGKTEGDYGDYSVGLACHPPAFECKITPRSPEAISLIHESIYAQ